MNISCYCIHFRWTEYYIRSRFFNSSSLFPFHFNIAFSLSVCRSVCLSRIVCRWTLWNNVCVCVILFCNLKCNIFKSFGTSFAFSERYTITAIVHRHKGWKEFNSFFRRLCFSLNSDSHSDKIECVSNLWFELANVYFDEVSKFRKVKYLIATFAFASARFKVLRNWMKKDHMVLQHSFPLSLDALSSVPMYVCRKHSNKRKKEREKAIENRRKLSETPYFNSNVV